jgi:hypothetical protein
VGGGAKYFKFTSCHQKKDRALAAAKIVNKPFGNKAKLK